MSKRAERRHHRARLIAKRKAYYGGYLANRADVARLVSTPTPCSCYMCKPSKHDGVRTLKERAFNCESLEDRE